MKPVGERLVSKEELMNLPDDGYRMELVRGVVVREPPPTTNHGAWAGNLYYLLRRYVDDHGLGGVVISSDAGFLLEEMPDTVRAPDVAYVSKDQVAGLPDRSGYWKVGPALVAEILSPGNRPGQIAEKVADYMAAGTRIVWLIDPERRRATIHTRGAPPFEIDETRFLEGGDVLPGFRCRLEDMLGRGDMQ